MCGRYSLTADLETLRGAFGFAALPNLQPRYNICPTQEAPIVRVGTDGAREIVQLRWGPPQEKGRGPLINARGETVARLELFKESFELRRCLVPADGFYEWRAVENKQPFRIGMKGGSVFAFAGIWSDEGFTIVTTTANAKLAPIHERMPVILAPESYPTWLGGDARAALDLVCPYPDAAMAFYRVGPHVNSARNDDPQCIVPLNPR
jgi:putative SOS response-associated peptidase YedK